MLASVNSCYQTLWMLLEEGLEKNIDNLLPNHWLLENLWKILGNFAIHWCTMALRTRGKMSSEGFLLIVLSDFQPLEQGLKACGA